MSPNVRKVGEVIWQVRLLSLQSREINVCLASQVGCLHISPHPLTHTQNMLKHCNQCLKLPAQPYTLGTLTTSTLETRNRGQAHSILQYHCLVFESTHHLEHCRRKCFPSPKSAENKEENHQSVIPLYLFSYDDPRIQIVYSGKCTDFMYFHCIYISTVKDGFRKKLKSI